MIRHTILFKTKFGISDKTAETACNNFLALKNQLPGIVTMIGGKCKPHHEKDGKIFTHAFSIDFRDKDAMEIFFHDPITHPAKDSIVNITDGGYEGLMGFDLDI